MSDGFLGKAVVDGVVRFFSVSALEKASPLHDGCMRRWWYRYVGKQAELEAAKSEEAKKKGIALHKELEEYQKTGVRALSPLALKGLHFVPPPGPGLIVAHKVHSFRDGQPVSDLTAGGVPLIGEIDCAHDRGINYGTEDPSEQHDPPGTVECLDYKRKGQAKDRNGKQTYLRSEQLITTIQMPGYGLWLAKKFGYERVRLSHGYFFEKGSASRKVTKLHVVRDLERAWEYTDGLGRAVTDVAKETVAERVEANLHACEAHGGCPMREICTARRDATLSTLFGETAAQEMTVGLIDQMSQAAPQPAPAQDPRAALMQEEQTLRAAQPALQAQAQIPPPAPGLLSQIPAPPPPPPAPPVPTPMAISPLKTLWDAIAACGRGTPALGGAAAQAYAKACGVQLDPHSGFAGTTTPAGVKDLAHLTLFEEAQIDQIATELGLDVRAIRAKATVSMPPSPVPTQVGPLPPDAPVSRPELATAGEQPAAAPAKRGPGRPPKTPKVQPEPAAEQAQLPAAASVPHPTPMAAAIPPSAAPQGTSPAPQPATPVTSPAATQAPAVGSGPIPSMRVYVDCIPSEPSVDLAGYVDKVCATLTQRYCVDAQGRPTTQDIRCAPESSPLGYDGKWGAIRALAKSAPPAVGVYHLRARGDRSREEVSEAMRELIAERGGIYVRGI